MPSTAISADFSRFWESNEERDLVWSALKPWFETYGYTLYPQDPDHSGNTRPEGSSVYELSKNSVELPHAYPQDVGLKGRAFLPKLAVFPAVNKECRDVIIKMLPSDNPELDIFRHIISEPQRSDPLNLTIPVLELLHSNDEYSFVIMPRWGNADSLDQCGFDSLRTAFDFVISLLKVLTFLHNHHIAYRDFKLSNVLVNTYFNNEFSFDYRPFLASKRAKFALCDFNLSVRFPPDTPPSAQMCPALESEWGSPQYHPPDAANGDIMYDPFAYDVACLGGLFCEVLGYLTPLAPPLAPFLDRMITPDVSSRYTAPQALAAFTALTERFSAKYLSKPIPQPPQEEEPLPWQSRDRWAGLPDALIKKHTRIRPPVRPRRKVPQFEGRSFFVDWDYPHYC